MLSRREEGKSLDFYWVALGVINTFFPLVYCTVNNKV